MNIANTELLFLLMPLKKIPKSRVHPSGILEFQGVPSLRTITEVIGDKQMYEVNIVYKKEAHGSTLSG